MYTHVPIDTATETSEAIKQMFDNCSLSIFFSYKSLLIDVIFYSACVAFTTRAVCARAMHLAPEAHDILRVMIGWGGWT